MKLLAIGQYLINPHRIAFIKRSGKYFGITFHGVEDPLVLDGDDAQKFIEALLSEERAERS